MDSSFGINGYKNYSAYSSGALDNPESAPIAMFYSENKYLLVQAYQIARFNSDGSRDLTFGIGGKAVIASPNHYFTIRSAKMGNDCIYVCGQVYNGGSWDKEGFVAKISLNGTFDDSFGSEGIAIFEISGLDVDNSDDLKDILIRENGDVYVTGKSVNTIIVFKLTPSGTTDLTYSPTGYRYFGTGIGKSLIDYQGDMLLISTIGTTKIDNSGNIDTNFGINGTLPLGGTSTEKAIMLNNILFYVRSVYVGSPGRGGYGYYTVEGYDINTFQSITPLIETNSYPGITIYDNMILLTDRNIANSDNNNTFFRIRRFNLDGNLDLSFNNTGIFIYTIPVFYFSVIYATACYVHDDGKIFIAGYDQHRTMTTGSHGLGMIRLVPSTLGIVKSEIENRSVLYPNPASDKIYVDNFENIEKISVYDIMGKEFRREIGNDGSITVNDLQSGAYIIKMQKNGIINSLKFVKK